MSPRSVLSTHVQECQFKKFSLAGNTSLQEGSETLHERGEAPLQALEAPLEALEAPPKGSLRKHLRRSLEERLKEGSKGQLKRV